MDKEIFYKIKALLNRLIMSFLEKMPAFRLKEYIIISDLHIGFEKTFEEKGYLIPNQSKQLLKQLEKLSKKSKKLIILGDVKHNLFLRQKYALIDFFKELSKLFEKIIIVKGNHDGGIENILDYFENIEVVNELLIGDILLIHGHKYASDELISKAKTILLGHFHSSFKFKNQLGIRQSLKSWNIFKFNNELFFQNKKIKTKINKVISFPCFNDFFQGTIEKNGPYAKYLLIENILSLDLISLI